MKDIVKCIPMNSEFIVIAWYVASICNYKCSYCIPEFHDGKVKFPESFDPMVKFIDKLKFKYPGKKILIVLYGGEVTLWKSLEPFLDYYNGSDVFITLVTNGHRKLEWWKRNYNKIERTIVSYHHEFANEEHITEMMKILGDRGQVNLMVHPDFFDETIEIGKRISKNANTLVIPKYLRIKFTNKLYHYTDEQLKCFNTRFITTPSNTYKTYFKYKGFELYKESGEIIRLKDSREIFLNNINMFKDWKCWGGVDSFFVDYGLNVYRGQCRRGMFANLLDEKYELPSKPFICDKDVCNCSSDIMNCKKEKY